MARTITVTTSLGTKWEAYSQTLLKMHVPEWPRVIIDGRCDWTPTGFVTKVLSLDSDYICHVDEDCFVSSREALLKLVAIFENDPSVVAAGIPDGGYYYRERNPAALNLFFIMFRTESLAKAWAQLERGEECSFQPEYAKEVTRQWPNLDLGRVNCDLVEPYYPLFWNMIKNGGKFFYLGEKLDSKRWSSTVLLPSGEAIAEHMWYLRNWFSKKTMQGHDSRNVDRYLNLQRHLHRTYLTKIEFWWNFGVFNLRRFYRRLRP